MIPPTDYLRLAADVACAFAFLGIVLLAVVLAEDLGRERWRTRSNVLPFDPKRSRAPRKEPAAE